MHQLGYQWSYSSEWPTLTTQGWQASVRVHKIAEDPETAPPWVVAYSLPCSRTFQAREGALFNALFHIYDKYHCRIRDLHFEDLAALEHQKFVEFLRNHTWEIDDATGTLKYTPK